MNWVVVSIGVLAVVSIAFGVVALRDPHASRATQLLAKGSMFGTIGGVINVAPSGTQVSDTIRFTCTIIGLCFLATSAVYIRRSYRALAKQRATTRGAAD